MERDPARRPAAEKVEEEIALISGLATAVGASSFCNPCCDSMSAMHPVHDPLRSGHLPAPFEMEIIVGNTYALRENGVHSYTFYVQASEPALVEKCHMYLVGSAPVIEPYMNTNSLLPASKFSKVALHNGRGKTSVRIPRPRLG